MLLHRLAVLSLFTFTLSSARGDTLLAHVDADTSVPGVWSYTVFDDEPSGSPNYVTSFNVLLDAAIVVTGTPQGWDVITDDLSYVFWYSADLALPYPDDIAPGNFLDGFSIASTAVVSILSDGTVAAWDHIADAPGPSTDLSVLAPSAETPEPSSFSLLLIFLGLLSGSAYSGILTPSFSVPPQKKS